MLNLLAGGGSLKCRFPSSKVFSRLIRDLLRPKKHITSHTVPWISCPLYKHRAQPFCLCAVIQIHYKWSHIKSKDTQPLSMSLTLHMNGHNRNTHYQGGRWSPGARWCPCQWVALTAPLHALTCSGWWAYSVESCTPRVKTKFLLSHLGSHVLNIYSILYYIICGVKFNQGRKFGSKVLKPASKTTVSMALKLTGTKIVNMRFSLQLLPVVKEHCPFQQVLAKFNATNIYSILIANITNIFLFEFNG